MRIQRIYVSNFRAFDELEIEVADGDADPFPVVALTGDNGSGKTSVLEAVRLAFSAGLTPGVIPPKAHRLADEAARIEVDVHFRPDDLEELCEVYRQRADLQADLVKTVPEVPSAVDGGTLRLVAVSAADKRGAKELVRRGSTGAFNEGRLRDFVSHATTHAPGCRLVYLPSERRLKPQSVSQVQRPRGIPSQPVIGQFGFDALKQYLVYLDWVRLKRREIGEPDPLGPYRDFVARLFADKTFEGVSEDMRVLFRTTDGLLVDFDELSSGERSVLALFGSLIRPEFRQCVYLIDEPEQHLHPRWQRQVPAVLAKHADSRRDQFVLATHSVEVAESAQEVGGATYDLSAPTKPGTTRTSATEDAA